MKNLWRSTLSLLGLLCLAMPQARSQIDCSHTVVGTGAVAAADGVHRVRATLGQSAVSYTLGGSNNAALGFWHAVPRSKAAAAYVAEEATTGSSMLSLDASPNPFTESIQLSLRVPEDEHVSLVLYDLLGQPVRSLLDTEHPEGTVDMNMFANDLPSGRYTLILSAGDERRTLPLLLVR